ncbi:hypothetical protein DYI23_11260 [Roseibium polysiphoniae]|uniref:Uncharacterized protein n=1 Tax=Roseibium polysiphoniae TaxID=2571221 RepID=A0A944GTT1_9HYPH|nr:hypothetical protein [Roseibium polysiphoniae]MBS8260800.1 hypothetical protein [Roseibium polysiphoniae]
MTSIAAHIPVISEASLKSFENASAMLVDVVHAPEPENIGQEDLTETAYRRGLDEGTRLAEESIATQLKALQEEHQAQLQELRDTTDRHYAEMLAEGLQKEFLGLEQRLAASLSNLLGPLVEERLSEVVVGSFASTLKNLWDREQALSIKVQGPASLLERLVEQLGPEAARIETEEAATGDLQVVLNDTLVESQLSNWLSMISEAGATEK